MLWLLTTVPAIAGCGDGSTTPSAEPSAGNGTSISPSATPPEAPKKQKRTGASEQVPDDVILEQLRLTAERIAQRMPSEAPTVLPADVSTDSNRGLGYRLLLDFGFPKAQWAYLDALWHRESGWNHLAENKSSGAYGIPQSLPGNKMAVVGADWKTNPETQIRWGLAYISARYGTPQQAWAHSERHGWY